jgi:hypothetical protein
VTSPASLPRHTGARQTRIARRPDALRVPTLLSMEPDTQPAQPAPVALGADLTCVYGPGGSCVYLHGASALIARVPFDGLNTARAFLDSFGVSVRVDLRDPAACAQDAAGGPGPEFWPVVALPVPQLRPRTLKTDRSEYYVKHRTALTDAAAVVADLLAAGAVPVVHCRASADRTGVVLAMLLAPMVGSVAAQANYAAAAAYAGSPRPATWVACMLAPATPAGQ